MPERPHVGLVEVDRLILLAMEKQFAFPVGVKRWALLAWAAEAIESQRADPQAFERTELARITEDHFPGATRLPPA